MAERAHRDRGERRGGVAPGNLLFSVIAKMARTPLTWRTQITRVVRKTSCCATSTPRHAN